MRRYLTKSRFKLALECPTKLYYTGKKEYANQKQEDSFLEALAEGGFQVGELAKCYFPGGHDIKTLNYTEALAQTNKLLQQDQVTIYEAAISTENLFIRADILVKNGNRLCLYEVKAKSFDPEEENPFSNKNGTIKSKWKSYLYDVAFQKYVLQKALPGYIVLTYLVLADKSAICPTDGLNQKFRIVKDARGRKSVSVSETLTSADLTPQLLCKVNVDDQCDQIFAGFDSNSNAGYHSNEKTSSNASSEGTTSFSEHITMLANQYASDTKIPPVITTACASCEFCTTENDEQAGLKSGRKECWKECLGWEDTDFDCPTVLDVWGFRRKASLLNDGCIKMRDMTEDDITLKPDNKPGISSSERQWLQIQKVKNHDHSFWIDKVGLENEMNSWVYPLHFIDFETTMVAIPFNAGRRPYEGIAFQFSHHIVRENGKIEHIGEYINTKQGVFPNYDFVRALKSQLENDNGSVFKYSDHENTFLNMIYFQLQEDAGNIPDKEDLCNFIQSITKNKKDSVEKWVGKRNMIDMLEIVKRFYYDPITNGSNSIKQVLPAILNRSSYLQKKYSEPIYGATNGIPSHNYTNWQWIQFENETVIDPYKLLPKMFQDAPDQEEELLSNANELRDGGAALTAYARMQFEEMSGYEREEIRKALLKYCELDTMAMVLLYEGWKDLLQHSKE